MRKKKDLIFVGIQLALFGLYVFLPAVRIFKIWSGVKLVGLAVALTGMIMIVTSMFQIRRSLTPFPSPVKRGKLVTTGIYKYIRHPIYSGIFLLTSGYGLQATDSLRVIISLALLLLFYFKSRYEEKMLVAFYDDYRQYRSHTYRFFPFL
ncbi:methyltransferase family protein [Dyadobacter sandarakinus]|uniref:Isoprenylcysteine carboxylmethyltransferase family protein n=1 Tax=Dyadobacter sandarakinus TaxID=2747268 RepID=A0ABX7I7T3_9BACT|nr:isoprenylcysteine carboxylmethyltransferase family protein [Dyadobacter sandarakinus]QRR01612.1 isoprenylcysteine carboxylmethyltransferase family protein [Dyadobacter sandarakinus]